MSGSENLIFVNVLWPQGKRSYRRFWPEQTQGSVSELTEIILCHKKAMIDS
jgi:hypothetical protein